MLRASGLAKADLICICIDDPDAATKIVDIVHEEFADVRTYVRAYDRTHAIALMNRDVDFQLRETVESALGFGRATLEGLGLSAEAARAPGRGRAQARRRPPRPATGGAMPDGSGWLRGTPEMRPEPLTAPTRPSRALSAETRGLIETQRHEAAPGCWSRRICSGMPERERSGDAGAARFVTGSILRHVVVMSGTGSVGLMAIFAVDLLSLFYVSKLGDPALTAAVGFASIVQFFAIAINIA